MDSESSDIEGSVNVNEQTVGLLRNSRTMEAQAEHLKHKRFTTLYSLVTILGITLVVLTFLWLKICLNGFSFSVANLEFNWHPLLMTFGMLFLYSQSMLVYRTGRNMPKFKLKIVHAGLNITICILVGLALKAVYDSHNYANPPIPNLYSIHSWLGVLTLSLFTCQLVIGFTSFLYPGAKETLKAMILPYHVIFGTSGFLMALVTAASGFTEKVVFALGSNYQQRPFSGILLNIIGVVLVIFGLLALNLVNNADFKREEDSGDKVTLSQ